MTSIAEQGPLSPAPRRELAALAVAVLLFCSPMFYTLDGFTSGDSYRSHDWQIAATHDAMFRNAVLVHHQFPLRSHLVGGGYPVTAHPSDASVSPMILPSLLLGERLGLKLNLVLAMMAGVLGIYLLAREVMGAPGHGPLYAALGFLVAGWHPSRVLVGYYESTFYLLFPLMLYLILTAGRSLGRLALAVAVTATCFMQVLGGGVTFVLWALAHVAWGFGGSALGQRRRRSLALLAGVLGLAALLGAVKFVPMLHLLSRGHNDRMDPQTLLQLPAAPLDRLRFTRSGEHYRQFRRLAYEGHQDFFYDSPASLARALLTPVPLRNEYIHLPAGDRTPRHPDYPHLNVGYAVLALGLLALVLLRRATRRSSLVLLLFGLICFGVHAPLDLFRPLSWLPVVNSMRRPMQYFNFFIYAELVLLAGFALAWLQQRLRRPLLRRLLLAGAVLALVPAAVQNAARYREAFRLPLPDVTASRSFFQVKLQNETLREQIATGYGDTYLNVLRRVGTVLWDSNIKLPESARPRFWVDDHGVISLAEGYRGEAHFSDPRNQVQRLSITPNEIVAQVKLMAADTLTINQNYDPAWRVEGAELVQQEGLLRLRMQPGSHTVRLRYRPWPFFVGLGISLATLLGLVLAAPRVRRRWLPAVRAKLRVKR